MDKRRPRQRLNPLVDLSGQATRLAKTWRTVAIWALPIGILAYIVAIYFELTLPSGSAFDIVSYSIVTALLLAMYGAMFLWLEKLQLIFTVNVLIVSAFYVLKLVYALFINPVNILSNVAGNFVWTPAVVVIAFFVPKIRGARAAVVVFSLLMAGLPAFYWIPNWIAGTNLAIVQVLLQITLSMLFTACLVYVLSLTGQHYTRVEGVAEAFQTMVLSDELTGLPNQVYFGQHLELTTERAQQEGSSFVVAFIDLDRLDSINDAYGRDVGDELLIHVGKRLQAYLGNDDLVARLHADEFAILSESVRTEKDVALFGGQLLKAFDNPMFLEPSHLELTVSASIGISRYPQDARNSIGLKHRAQQAVQHVKNQGRSGFSASSVTHFAEDSLANELRVDLLRGFSWENFQLHYQPVYDLPTNKIRGAEAVLSWRSSIGWTAVSELSSALNRSGDIIKLERAVLEHVCFESCRTSLESVAVDISPLHFAQPDFVALIRKILSETGLDPNRLTLEIAFATINSNPLVAYETMQQLSHMGVKLVLDDFGQEFIATPSLDRLPLAGAKLHPKLLSTYMLGRDQATFARTLLASLIEQAHEVGLATTALGVENEMQADLLLGLNCNYGQGEWWGQAMTSMPNSLNRAAPS